MGTRIQKMLWGHESSDATLKLWNLGTGQCVQTMQGHDDWVRALVVDWPLMRAISGSDDCTVVNQI